MSGLVGRVVVGAVLAVADCDGGCLVLKYSRRSLAAWLAVVPVGRKGLGGRGVRWSSWMRSLTAAIVRSVFDVAGSGIFVEVKTTVSQSIVARVRGI